MTLSYNMAGAVEATGLSDKRLKRAIGSGELRARKTNRAENGDPVGNWVILADDLRDFLRNLPAA